MTDSTVLAGHTCYGCKVHKPFSEFHRNKRRASGYDGKCKSCAKVQSAAYYRANKDRIEARVADWRSRNPGWAAAQSWRVKYGLSADAYWEMYETQDGKCALCGKKFAHTPHVDHDHDTGLVRSLLCRVCNVGLGQFGDDPVRLRAAADYVESYRS